jgi:hypothetical protein
VFSEKRGVWRKNAKERKAKQCKIRLPKKKFAKGDGSPILLEHWNKALLFPLSL